MFPTEYQHRIKFSLIIPMKAFFLISNLYAMSRIQVSFSNQVQTHEIAKQIAGNLMGYYNDGTTAVQGCIIQNSAKNYTGYEWYEGGKMWSAMMEYTKVIGDGKYINVVSDALSQASAGSTGSFLGKSPKFSETLLGRGNDDILWWAFGPAAAAELLGKDAKMPSGVSFLNLAQTTYDQVWGDWDSSCGGGIWWSRNREGKDRYYKSTISQSQQIYLGARLLALQGDKGFSSQTAQIYNYLVATGLITSDKRILDGINSDTTCRVNQNLYSYQNGMLIGALAWLGKGTSNSAYINEANNLARAALATYAPNSIFIEPCEPSCNSYHVAFKGILIRGLGYLYEFTDDMTVKGLIKKALTESVGAMLSTCDNNYNCGNIWTGQPNLPSNVHDQLNALELITAYAKTFVDGPIPIPKLVTTPSSQSAGFSIPRYTSVNICFALFIISWIFQ
ncbi:glycosyl hydrolase family 76-domain-containing protein [Globomyces pollinis-pini]|nr:glycosyl hydrolase family 76-domain-containing protein [Globomyces pollinis-pini]